MWNTDNLLVCTSLSDHDIRQAYQPYARKCEYHISRISLTPSLLRESPRTVSTDPVAIIFYGMNILCIITTLFWMRSIIYAHPETDLSEVSHSDVRYGRIRVFLSLICTLIAIALAYIHPASSFIFFIIPLIFSLIPGAIAWLDRDLIHRLMKNSTSMNSNG